LANLERYIIKHPRVVLEVCNCVPDGLVENQIRIRLFAGPARSMFAVIADLTDDIYRLESLTKGFDLPDKRVHQ